MRILTSFHSICVIWVCISSSSRTQEKKYETLITPLVEAHLSTTTRSWATLKWAYTTPVFLSSPLDLLMDKAPRASSSDNFLKASHLSGSNGVDCDLNGANHILDFKTLEGLSPFTLRQHLCYSRGHSREKAKSCQQREQQSYKEARLGAERLAERSEWPNRERTK